MMSSPHLLRELEDLSQNFGEPSAQRGLRLSDAERIATDRLEGAPQGSLKEALATRSPQGQSAPRLADRIESVREDYSSAPAPYPEAVHAHGTMLYGWPEPMPPAHAVELPAPGEQPDLFDLLAQTAPEPTDLATVEVAETVQQGFAGAAHQIWPSSPPPSSAALIEAVQPLVNAYEATARLAADATAASDALENLRQLLTMRLAEGQTSAPPLHDTPIPAPLARQAGPASLPPPLPPSHQAVAPAAPTPEPIRTPAEMVAEADAFPVMPLPPQPPPAMPVERVPRPRRARRPARARPAHQPGRQQFDVRGFFAGFALSWAVGVVLYFYMTAG